MAIWIQVTTWRQGFYYDESVRVPFIVNMREISGGRTDRSHLISTDWISCQRSAITLCREPTHLLGDSLRPLASGEDVDQWRSHVIPENSWFRMVRVQNLNTAWPVRQWTECLVDMDNDRGEMQTWC